MTIAKWQLAGLWTAVATTCASAWSAAPAEDKPQPTPRSIALPGASPTAGVAMDYIAYDSAQGRLWVPAGNTGSVDVIDVVSEKVTRIEGFATREVERQGAKRTVGPSAAVVGDGVVYVGSRGDSSLCAVVSTSLALAGCVKLPAVPDGLAYLPSARELWVTTPAVNAISVLDITNPSRPLAKTTFTLDGAPEGFAIDDAHGVVYTNLEDKDQTLTIDVKSRKVTRTWPSQCGEQGPRGLFLDRAFGLLVVACPDKLAVFDAGHDGKRLSSIAAGAGIDNIDAVETRHEFYAAGGLSATLVVARLAPSGELAIVARVTTSPGARNAVVTREGKAFVTDSRAGRVLVLQPQAGVGQ